MFNWTSAPAVEATVAWQLLWFYMSRGSWVAHPLIVVGMSAGVYQGGRQQI